MDNKFGSLCGGWCSIELSNAFGVGLWKNIRSDLGNFSCHIRFELGDESKIRFWSDQWWEDVALKEAF